MEPLKIEVQNGHLLLLDDAKRFCMNGLLKEFESHSVIHMQKDESDV